MDEFKKFLYETKHNRDYYSRAKIIEMIDEKYDELDCTIINQNMRKILELANRDECYCSDAYKCNICEASSTLNDIGEILQNKINEMGYNLD